MSEREPLTPASEAAGPDGAAPSAGPVRPAALPAAALSDRTVLESAVEVLRAHGLTTIFGNPGSNELPFLAALPEDFDYVLGLQEAVVLGMADGYAQASGRPVLVNLHAASGTGNSMGALTNAHYAHSPLVVIAGQQVRATVGQEAMLANADAALLTRPLTKEAAEPLSAQDVPRAIAQAALAAATAPAGPVYLSIPYDDWSQPALASDSLLPRRRVRSAGALGPELAAELAERLAGWSRPVLVLGPDADTPAARERTQALAEALGAPVWTAPSAPRLPFPTDHPHYRGVLPPGIESVRARLADHDGVLVIGAPVMRYHRWEPAAYLEPGTDVLQLTVDPGEAVRAPYGDAIVCDLAEATAQLAAAVGTHSGGSTGRQPAPGPESAPESAARSAPRDPEEPAVPGAPLTGAAVIDVLNERARADIAYVNEATTLDVLAPDRLLVTRAGQYMFPASGGLGFGMAAAVGAALARPEDTVVGIIGDGSAHYAITALYTAAQRATRTVFVIVDNASYGALRGFARALRAERAPGLDLPGLDLAAIARGYGVPAEVVTTREALREAYGRALEAGGPVVIVAKVSP
ncbi:benzoylformate decarboxylase [Brevibacterium rongguiense]|uniref:benzoylformate decarboxylase n=1 Tax=Brevibacterium rongguiense TaxID=2695267 RepID=UPI002E2C7BC6|nr:benzoylformate decarboxylase [Brevibacterium rongguiense]